MTQANPRKLSFPTRRQAIGTALLGGGALLSARRAQAAGSRIEILLNEPIGTISPDLYGHFTEHIGGVIYDGIWVGEDSKIPNYRGIRKALVDRLRPLKPSVMRWPGGCFAETYDWRDGIGPCAQRPRRTNFWVVAPFMQKAPDGPQKYETNQFGTHEFMRFCKLVGAQPYLAANVRSLTPMDFLQWVEYCNAPAGRTTLSDARAANGDRDPFGVRFWGIGNESCCCGGNFTPEEYATEFRKFATAVPQHGLNLAFIGAGPIAGDLEWTRRFFRKLTEQSTVNLRKLYGWALHYYCGTTGKGQAIDFTEQDWYELLGQADRMESLIAQHWAAMGEIDTEHRVKLVVDEWGAWHKAGTEVDPTYLFGQMPTMRDALISALTLDTFNRHADKVAMGNVAQLINNLHCLFLAREDRFTVTTNYHVFDLYAAHYNGQSVRTVFSAPGVSYSLPGGTSSLWGIAGSASVNGKQLVLTVVNPHVREARETEITARGASFRSAEATVLASSDIHAHNSFAQPDAVKPVSVPVKVAGGVCVHRFPPASVTRLRLTVV
jgi:alpha-N-arabinofuranosidase